MEQIANDGGGLIKAAHDLSPLRDDLAVNCTEACVDVLLEGRLLTGHRGDCLGHLRDVDEGRHIRRGGGHAL